MPSRRILVSVLVAVCGVLAACGTGSAQPGSAPGPGSGHRSASAVRGAAHPSASRVSVVASPAATPGSAGIGRSTITLAFAGEVHFPGRTTQLLRHPATAFGPISSLLRSADLTLVNLETAVTSRGQPQPKYYHFRTRPAAFTALRDAGIDVANMANNHVLDYGRVGLADTMAAARAAHFPVLGIGADAAAAWKPYLVTIKGVRIAFLGVSQVAELASSWVATSTRSGEANSINLHRTLPAVRAARNSAA